MADPFAAALARLHVSAASVAASFTPDGGTVDDAVLIRVIRGQPSQEVAYGDASIMLDTNQVQIRRADVADPTGGTLTLGAEIFSIQGAPSLDIEGLTWTCHLEPVG
jgi:hypothetical protein